MRSLIDNKSVKKLSINSENKKEIINKMNIFKIEYNWYEGEHEEILLAKDTEREQFEKDLLEAKKFCRKTKREMR